MLQPEILDYYGQGGERDRLAAGPGRLEFLRTWDVLTRVLPSAPAAVLDVGGATGVYAGPLVEAGYRVDVVDPVPWHVAEAAARPGVSAVLGDARALPFASRSVDAVLLLGPLYHLQERSDRVATWREAGRVLRPGGVVVGATISRFASLFDGFVKNYYRRSSVSSYGRRRPRRRHAPQPQYRPGLVHHRLLSSSRRARGRGDEAGLVVQRRIAVESPLWMTGARLDDILADTELLLEMLRRIEEEPSLLGASSHMLTVAGLAPSGLTPTR